MLDNVMKNKVPHGSSQQTLPYERNIPRPYGRGYELEAGKIDTHHPLSSVDQKIYVINERKSFGSKENAS